MVDRIGDYEVVELLGEGGMGAVYRVRDGVGRELALKLLTRSSEKVRERFRREGRALARLDDHPAIVGVLDAGSVDDHLYYVMELVEGPDLQTILDRHGPLSWRDAVDLVIPAARALGHAHRAGIIHRDVKPANIVRGPAGPVVTDFGLAHDPRAGMTLTRTGAMLGTPAYMPPEQATGKRHLVGPASDVYALAATLQALITGHPPVEAREGDTPATWVRRLLEEDPAPLEGPDIPPDLTEIVARALAKDTDRRPSDGDALADALGAVRENRSVEGLLPHASLGRRLLPLAGGALAVLLLALLVALGSGLVGGSPPDAPAEAGDATRGEVDPSTDGPSTDAPPATDPLDRAATLLEEERPGEALRIAARVLEDGPDRPGGGRALELIARAARRRDAPEAEARLLELAGPRLEGEAHQAAFERLADLRARSGDLLGAFRAEMRGWPGADPALEELLSPAASLPVESEALDVGEVDGDPHPEIVLGHGRDLLLVEVTADEIQTSRSIRSPAPVRALVAAEVLETSDPQAVAAFGTEGSWHVVPFVFGSGDQQLTWGTPAVEEPPGRVVTGEWNGRPGEDVAFLGRLSGPGLAFLHPHETRVSVSFTRSATPHPSGLAAADLTGNGFSDLLVATRDEEGPLVELHVRGRQGFEPRPLFRARAQAFLPLGPPGEPPRTLAVLTIFPEAPEGLTAQAIRVRWLGEERPDGIRAGLPLGVELDPEEEAPRERPFAPLLLPFRTGTGDGLPLILTAVDSADGTELKLLRVRDDLSLVELGRMPLGNRPFDPELVRTADLDGDGDSELLLGGPDLRIFGLESAPGRPPGDPADPAGPEETLGRAAASLETLGATGPARRLRAAASRR